MADCDGICWSGEMGTSTLLATDLGVPLLARPAVISALLDEPAVAHDHRTSLLVNGITVAIILRTKGLVT
jgi:hypothetical protein